MQLVTESRFPRPPSPVYSLFAQVLWVLVSRRQTEYFRSKIRAQTMVPEHGSPLGNLGSLLMKENLMGLVQPRLR